MKVNHAVNSIRVAKAFTSITIQPNGANGWQEIKQ
jgi:hypothetical protein